LNGYGVGRLVKRDDLAQAARRLDDDGAASAGRGA
jgi:hypothetical protein